MSAIYRLHGIFVFAALGGLIPQVQNPPSFSVVAHVARIELSVFGSEGNVRGLTAADFRVSDAGQTITSFLVQELSDLPLDVVLVAQPRRSLSELQLPLFSAATAALASAVRPVDRLGVVVASTPPQRLRVLGFSQPGWETAAGLMGTTESATWDAVAAALFEFDSSDRRKVLLVLADGQDSFSLISPDRIGPAALSLNVQIVFLGSTSRLLQSIRYTWPNMRQRESMNLANLFTARALETLASETGGQVIDLLDRSPEELTSALMEQLRGGYLITYETAAAPGWHPVSIHVSKRGARVAARAGYFVRNR